MSEPLDPIDPFERELTDRLEAIVHGEAAPFALVDRAAARSTELARQRRLRRGVTGAGLAALGVAAAWLLAVAGPVGDGVRHQDAVAIGPDGRPISTTTQPHDPTSSTSSSTSTTEPDEATSTTRGERGGVIGGTVRGTTSTTSLAATTLSTAFAPDAQPEPQCVEVTGKPNTVHDDWAREGASHAWWSAQPNEDKPVTLTVCVDDLTPREGQQVTLTVTATDPDQAFVDGDCAVPVVAWGDEDEAPGSLCRDTIAQPSSPQPLPAAQKGTLKRTFTHEYSAQGPVTIHVEVASGPDAGGPQPYASTATADLPIAVH